MSTGWAIFSGLVLISFSIGFFLLGFFTGDEMARDERDDQRTRLLERERELRDIDRAAFIAMLSAAEHKAQGGTTPKRGPGLPQRSEWGDH